MRYDPMIARLYHPEDISHDVTKLEESLLAIFFQDILSCCVVQYFLQRYINMLMNQDGSFADLNILLLYHVFSRIIFWQKTALSYFGKRLDRII